MLEPEYYSSEAFILLAALSTVSKTPQRLEQEAAQERSDQYSFHLILI